MKQTPEQIAKMKATINKVFTEAEKLMSTLYSRWLDEKQFENIKDYAQPIQPILTRNAVKFIKMNKRPFGFEFDVDGTQVRVSINSRQYKWETINFGNLRVK